MTGTGVLDAHVRIGMSREAGQSPQQLLATMAELGIERSLISPPERCVAVANAEGNAMTSEAARASQGRLLAYAVANPWFGTEALHLLRTARDGGAVALCVDPVLQGFDLHDGLLVPLLELVQQWGWPVYVRTGTPPTALPLPLASLARQFPGIQFVMGRSGATDFWIDAAPALCHAGNLYADTSYAHWDTLLGAFAANPLIGPQRIVFSTDSPYTVPGAELRRARDWPVSDEVRRQILGATMSALLPG